MITASKMELTGVRAAQDPLIFIATNGDGTINWDKTRATVTVFCNKHSKGNEHVDVFELFVTGQRNITTLANQVAKGKVLDRVMCYVTMMKDSAQKLDQNGALVLGKNGQAVKVDVPRFFVQTLELGPDSINMEKERVMRHINGMRAQGTIPPHIGADVVELIVNAVYQARATKSKNEAFDSAKARATGRWGYARLWSEGTGHWLPQGGYVPPVTAPAQGVQLPQGMDAQTMLAFAQMLVNQQNAATVTAPPATQQAGGVVPPEPGDPNEKVWQDDEIPF